jgi:predicted metal-binding transcription factor (methanogenesis marker protein 9)
MSITANVTMTIAEAEITDEYRVQLRTAKKRTDLSPDEAMQLADELAELAMEASTKLREDVRARGMATISHGFDQDGPVAS